MLKFNYPLILKTFTVRLFLIVVNQYHRYHFFVSLSFIKEYSEYVHVVTGIKTLHLLSYYGRS